MHLNELCGLQEMKLGLEEETEDMQLTQCGTMHVTPAGYVISSMCESNRERTIKQLKID